MNETMRRLEILRLDNNVKAVDICKHLGISKSTYSTWKSRDIFPDTKYIPEIADFFGVSCDYLLTGAENSLSVEESELIAAFNSMNDDGKRLLAQRIEELVKLGYVQSDVMSK